MKTSFSAIATIDAKILILGSMPGEESLKQQRYYAHPRNAFWYIMSHILGFDNNITYPEKINRLKASNIALWDVLKRCHRSGSLDSSIQSHSIETNNFKDFYHNHSFIQHVFFNGAKAEQEYKKRVLPTLQNANLSIKYHKFTSTSPAMAARTKEEKLTEWRHAIDEAMQSI
ncbi:MAG TPA: DNA-deoxyinosine glycosylase [Gammaproteobacteria bacterium]|nr:DNA-deoxyinosine glycosylase [Gammaproteobacteria bacterium]